jgi:hypothetical protein
LRQTAAEHSLGAILELTLIRLAPTASPSAARLALLAEGEVVGERRLGVAPRRCEAGTRVE